MSEAISGWKTGKRKSPRTGSPAVCERRKILMKYKETNAEIQTEGVDENLTVYPQRA